MINCSSSAPCRAIPGPSADSSVSLSLPLFPPNGHSTHNAFATSFSPSLSESLCLSLCLSTPCFFACAVGQLDHDWMWPRFTPTVVMQGTHPVRAVAFSPDGWLFAAGSNNRALRVCRAPTEQDLWGAAKGACTSTQGSCVGAGGSPSDFRRVGKDEVMVQGVRRPGVDSIQP